MNQSVEQKKLDRISKMLLALANKSADAFPDQLFQDELPRKFQAAKMAVVERAEPDQAKALCLAVDLKRGSKSWLFLVGTGGYASEACAPMPGSFFGKPVSEASSSSFKNVAASGRAKLGEDRAKWWSWAWMDDCYLDLALDVDAVCQAVEKAAFGSLLLSSGPVVADVGVVFSANVGEPGSFAEKLLLELAVSGEEEEEEKEKDEAKTS